MGRYYECMIWILIVGTCSLKGGNVRLESTKKEEEKEEKKTSAGQSGQSRRKE